MKVEISVAEVVEVFKELQNQPEKILETVKADVPQAVFRISERNNEGRAQWIFRQRSL